MRKTAIFVLLVLFAMLAMPAASAATMTVVADPPQVFSCDPVPIPVTINVTDTSTGTPIDGANVTFRGTYWSTSNITTNGECTFYVNNPYDPNGKFWVDANATGYDNVIGIEIPIYPYHGYKGKSYTCGPDMTTWKTYDLNGNLVYSVGDSYYLSSSATSGDPDWTAYDVAWTASDLPVTGTIKEARLYTTYTWDKGVIPTYVSLSFNGVAQTPDAHYSDEKGWGTSYPYGMLAYDVTSDFNPSGNYANLTNSYTGGDNVSMRGMVLMVIYEDASEPARQIYINEEFDLLYGGSSYYTTPEEATAWAPITGPAIDMAGVVSARLITVAPGAGAHGNGKTPVEGDLIFNGQIWTDAWDFAGIGDAAATETEIGIDERDVTSYLQSTDNLVGIRSDGDWMEASNAILVVEMEASVGTFTGSGTAYFESSAGTIEDLTAIAEETLPAAGGKPNLLFPHGFFSFNITGLMFGQTASVTITLPDNVPVGTQYWKYLASTASWTQIPMTSVDDGDNVIVIHLTDGGAGDDDCVQNGVIVDPGSVGVESIVYFVPHVSEASGGAGTNFTVDVRVNATETINLWQTDIAFDYSCIDVINVTYGWSGYTGLWTWGPGQITMGDARIDPISGDMLLATLTIHCKDCCASSLDFTGIQLLKSGATARSTSWENGSVICGTPVDVEKTVWDPNADAWVDTMDVQDLYTNVTFNCTVHATCCNLTDLVVTDEMDDGLMYSGGATVNGVPCPPDEVKDAGRTLVWNTLSDLDAGETMTIKFNATTEAYGVPCNVVTVTGLCNGIPISADDDACIRMGMPKIAVDPIETIVQPQEQFDINITVDPSGACTVYGVEYDLHYDPTVLRAESLVKGPFLGEISQTMVTYINIDEVNGIVSYAETRKDPPCPGGVTDKDVVTRIHFTTIGERGDNTTLILTTVTIVDNATMEAFEPVDIINGNVSINNNVPPVPIPQSKHRINNVAQKYQSTAILCSCSYDPDGFITYLRWAFGDGQYGTSEGLHSNNCTCKEHDYESHQWEPYGDSGGHYVNFSATLTVTDSGSPELSNSTFMNVTVYIAGDANGDGKVNVLDAVWVGKHWRETCCTSPPCDPCGNCMDYLWVDGQADGADLNNDCKINVLDAVIIGANWRHVAW